jgi:hypothetical protein
MPNFDIAYPFDSQQVSQAQWREQQNARFSNGVVSGLNVTPAPSGLTVTVQPGVIWCDGVYAKLVSATTLTLPPVTSARNDNIVARVDNTGKFVSLSIVDDASVISGNVIAAVKDIPLARIPHAANATNVVGLVDKRRIIWTEETLDARFAAMDANFSAIQASYAQYIQGQQVNTNWAPLTINISGQNTTTSPLGSWASSLKANPGPAQWRRQGNNIELQGGFRITNSAYIAKNQIVFALPINPTAAILTAAAAIRIPSYCYPANSYSSADGKYTWSDFNVKVAVGGLMCLNSAANNGWSESTNYISGGSAYDYLLTGITFPVA